MTKLVSCTVLRGHLGDKITDDGLVQHYFEPGETREANPTVVAHLIPLTLEDPDAKADDDHDDKSEGDSDENKAGGGRRRKAQGE